MWTYLYDESGRAGGAYFTDVERVKDDGSPLGTEVIALRAPVENKAPVAPSPPGNYRIGDNGTITFNAVVDTLKNPKGIKAWSTPKFKDGSNLAGLDFPSLGIKSWSTDTLGESAKTIWDGAKLNGLTLNFTGHNFGYKDTLRNVNFSGATINTTGNQPFLFVDLTGADLSGATLNIAGFSGRMAAFRNAKLAGADFSNATWGIPTKGLTEKTENFFSGGPGTTSATDKHLAVTFANADLSRITGPAKLAIIKNLGKFDGATPIGAKYNTVTLTKSGWTTKELNAAGWQKIPMRQ